MGTICIIFKQNYWPNSSSSTSSDAEFRFGSGPSITLNFENTSCIGPENDRESHEINDFEYEGPLKDPPNLKLYAIHGYELENLL